jgi:hypothetical protein
VGEQWGQQGTGHVGVGWGWNTSDGAGWCGVEMWVVGSGVVGVRWRARQTQSQKASGGWGSGRRWVGRCEVEGVSRTQEKKVLGGDGPVERGQ